MTSRIVYRYVYMAQIVADAIAILKEKSPVGSGTDKHPGLYRDSHLIFIDGHVVKDASGWHPGQQINISNPVPYSKKIESGKFKGSVPGHVYEDAAQILAGKYGDSVSIKFVLMPVRFGSSQAFATSAEGKAGIRKSKKTIRDWLIHQPALEISAR